MSAFPVDKSTKANCDKGTRNIQLKQQMERFEFDHLMRAKRKYSIQQKVVPLIIANSNNWNQATVSLFQKWNQANKQKHIKKIIIRDRLREIQHRHSTTFAETVNIIKQQRKSSVKPDTEENIQTVKQISNENHKLFSISPLIRREQMTLLIDGYIRKI
eukprot:550496_1